MQVKEFDYIVCGAGSAGCVVATRLIEQNKGTVLLLEAGGSDQDFNYKIPAGIPVVINSTWNYTTEPDARTHHREMSCAQGKVLGGSSSVNGMIYLRGQAEDYDEWADVYGCTGWDFQSILPYFKKSENNESLSGEYHGTQGHFVISDTRLKHPLTRAFIKAGQELGLPYVNDFNGQSQQGVGFYQHNIKNGERGSTSRTYLASVRQNPQLTVQLNTQVEKVLVEQGKATGIECRINGTSTVIKARKGVVLSSGSIGSAKILLLSGIGPKEHLDSLGIEVKQDLPVGKNYHDHLHTSINATIKRPISLYGEDKGLKRYKHGLQWLLFREGVVASSVLEGGAFIDSNHEGRPDVQAMFLPVLDVFDDPSGQGKNYTHGITLKMCHLRPKSRGQLYLRSKNLDDAVRIEANLLEHPDDLQGLIRATQFGLDLLQQPSLSNEIDEVFAPDHTVKRDDVVALERFVREYCKTTYHPVGTCRMGQSPQDSVVDLNLKVHGIDQLSVIDCSVFPSIPSANTNAPTVAIAEKGADVLIQRS
ncbi:GMC family oxidoreductase N-terminal domain-containing protein [Acinetobacter sp. VNK23]|uniref:GMC family oxidoreductase n=1 Tax=Acinetobacter thutiue TaxID=2998078 RepID=UPI002577B2D6|nr:GMC family oxidoreductase N-terminal domain-containing protein [Acinetobacter thutiue]MDM1019378.1 GMC family oxidoreductase N-terminal domain-containing protein [Acinetobacter thutiue]